MRVRFGIRRHPWQRLCRAWFRGRNPSLSGCLTGRLARGGACGPRTLPFVSKGKQTRAEREFHLPPPVSGVFRPAGEAGRNPHRKVARVPRRRGFWWKVAFFQTKLLPSQSTTPQRGSEVPHLVFKARHLVFQTWHLVFQTRHLVFKTRRFEYQMPRLGHLLA